MSIPDPHVHEVTLRLRFDRPVSAWMAMTLAGKAFTGATALEPSKEGDPTSVKVLNVQPRPRRS